MAGVTLTLQKALEQALSAYRAGKAAAAEEICRQIVSARPDVFDALHLLAVVQAALGKKELALASYDRALELRPNHAEALNNRGITQRELKRLDKALASYDRALELRPDYVEALYNRGNALNDLKRHDEALASYDRALELRPADASILNNRGNALRELGRYDEALASYERALELRPDHADALKNRGNLLTEVRRHEEALASYGRALELRPSDADTLFRRGNVLRELERHEEALASFGRAVLVRPDYPEALNGRGLALQALKRDAEALADYDRALAVRPDYPEALNHRGNALQELKRYREALASYERALELRPDDADALNNRGNALVALSRWEDALASYDQAVTLKPNYAEALCNRGNVLRELNRLDEALASYDRAIALKPDYADGFKNRALCRLLAGRFSEGWRDNEWRWDAKDFPSERPSFTSWQGEDLEGRRLLVFAEQGLGDNVQFARYLPLVARNGCRLTFLADARLIRLLRPLTSGIEVVSALGAERSFDFQCALLSLPYRFGTDLASIPKTVPYLRAEDALVARWKARIGEHGFKIGIAWQGSPGGRIDRGRSIALSEYLGLARVPGVRLISLQKGPGLDQLGRLAGDVRIETLGEGFDGGSDAFIDTAAVMASLDLIITSDTSIAHVAGALARPTWVALKQVPDWRWLLDREDSPWYPTMRLFRQSAREDWKPVFSAMERELRSLLGALGRQRKARLMPGSGPSTANPG